MGQFYPHKTLGKREKLTLTTWILQLHEALKLLLHKEGQYKKPSFVYHFKHPTNHTNYLCQHCQFSRSPRQFPNTPVTHVFHSQACSWTLPLVMIQKSQREEFTEFHLKRNISQQFETTGQNLLYFISSLSFWKLTFTFLKHRMELRSNFNHITTGSRVRKRISHGLLVHAHTAQHSWCCGGRAEGDILGITKT